VVHPANPSQISSKLRVIKIDVSVRNSVKLELLWKLIAVETAISAFGRQLLRAVED
jgi:hypothetical protein